MKKLKFSKGGNAKLDKKIASFSLPAGHSCPFARDCYSKADKQTGKISDGRETQFRCFAASGEATFSAVRKQRWHNFDLLKGRTTSQMVNLISASLPKAPIVRIHVSGDFYSQAYFDAWMEVARLYPEVIFYAYTKALKLWIKRLNDIPSNFQLIASRGGQNDSLIDEYGLRCAEVVFSEQQAIDKGLQIDHDDSLAIYSKESFALLIHGTQPAGSAAAKAWASLGKVGYSRKRAQRVEA